MHCSACIWLLENLYKLNPGVVFSEVNFLQKKLSVKFKQNQISYRSLVELLVSIGYEPQISLDSLDRKIKYTSNRKLYYRIGVAGQAQQRIYSQLLSAEHVAGYRSR